MTDQATPVSSDEVSFTLDGRAVSANKGEMLIAAAERAGVYIPRFCYHPRMEPVGMCRMCLVEVDGPRGATLQPSCFIPVTDEMVVTTNSDKVKKAQDGVLEFLLVNHPLDCPVCDKGGECPLQDQTMAYGPGESRFIEEKRHFEKPIAISQLVLLDRERCIQCARCTRFAAEIAGEAQIDFAGRGETTEVATFPTEPFSSYFSGNTVQICPVGALTATPYRFTARPWDLDQVESTCTSCSFGCRVAVQSSSNRLTRLLGIDADPVNHGWLCDKGRFAFESVNNEQGRLTDPMIRKNGELVAVSWSEALSTVAEITKASTEKGGAGSVGVIGGARLTNEGAYAWARLAKGVIGTDSVDAQLGDGLPATLIHALPRATINETCSAKAVVLLTGDVREELPVLFLRLRAAALAGDTKLIEIAAGPSSLTPYASVVLSARPGDAATLAAALSGTAAVALPDHPEGAATSVEAVEAARALVGDGEGVVVVVGRPSMAESADLVAAAAMTLSAAWPGATFLPALRRGNVVGALDMGLAPGLLPGRVDLQAGAPIYTARWGQVPTEVGLDTGAMLSSLAGDGGVETVFLIGADPVSDFPDTELATRALANAGSVIAVAAHHSALLDYADVVLPAATAHERPGTTTNIEGRVSRLSQKLVPPGASWPDWMIAAELAAELGSDWGITGLSELTEEISQLAPAYRGLDDSVLEGQFSLDGILVPLSRTQSTTSALLIDPIALPGVESVERQGAPARIGQAQPQGADELSATVAPGAEAVGVSLESLSFAAPSVPAPDQYALRLVASRRLYDAGSAVTTSDSLAALIPVATARANSYDLDRIGAAKGTPVRLRSAKGSITIAAHPDDAIARGVVAVEFNVAVDASGVGVGTLIDAADVVTDVRLESL